MLTNSHQVPARDPGRAEGPAEQRRALRRSPADAPGERGDAEQLQRPRPGADEGDSLQPPPSQRPKQQRGSASGVERAVHAPSEPRATSAARVTLNQRTAPPRVSITEKTQPADRHRLAAPRHAAELVGDEAADGVELVVGQRTVEGAR